MSHGSIEYEDQTDGVQIYIEYETDDNGCPVLVHDTAMIQVYFEPLDAHVSVTDPKCVAKIIDLYEDRIRDMATGELEYSNRHGGEPEDYEER